MNQLQEIAGSRRRWEGTVNNRYFLFGMYLKNARESFKLTQAQLAKKMGVSIQTISNWECGQCLPPSNKTPHLAKIFGVGELDIMKVRAQATYAKYKNKLEMQGTYILPGPGDESDGDYEKMLTKPSLFQSSSILLIDSQTTENPTGLLKNQQGWSGKRYDNNLIPTRQFGFHLLDKSMEPEFRQGSVIICDTSRRIPETICGVLIKIKNTPPLFRVYVKEKNKIELKPHNKEFPTQVIKTGNIEWIYPVVKSILETI